MRVGTLSADEADVVLAIDAAAEVQWTVPLYLLLPHLVLVLLHSQR